MGDEVVKTTLGGIVIGGLSGVISGAVGSGIMISANHTGYNVLEAVEMGATGGGILLGGAALIGSLSSFSFFNSKAGASCGLTGFVLNCFLSGLIGYGILHEAAPVVAMEFYETAITFLVGAAVFGGSASVAGLVAFCCGAMMCCAWFNNTRQSNEEGVDHDFSQVPTVDYGSFNTNFHNNAREIMERHFPKVSVSGSSYSW